MTDTQGAYTAAWLLRWSCPDCGSGDLTRLTGTPPAAIGTRLVAVARCESCAQEWQLTTTLRPVGRKPRSHQPS